MAIRVTIWNEYEQEREDPPVAAIYPDGIHMALKAGLNDNADFTISTATLDQVHNGLTVEKLAATDVLVWWGHQAHAKVDDEVVDRIQERILDGMGLISLHSSHYSKIFRRMMGTSCSLKWRAENDKERLWVVSPGHPIASGLPERFEIEVEEMYGEHFDIPQPDELVFISWFTGGEVFRSGCCYSRGRGKVFYFRPGHETCPSYYNANVLQVIANAIRWAAPGDGPIPQYAIDEPVAPLEPLPVTG